MRIVKVVLVIALNLLISAVFAAYGLAQNRTKGYALTQFDNEGCMAKGRVQDCSGTVMQEILADEKKAIPVLISQLTDTTRTKYQISDYWFETRSGDVAYVILTDLFTDDDLRTFFMPNVPNWPTVMNGCDKSAEGCWDDYLRKHGRRSVQQAWFRAWNRYRDVVYWDAKARCFRLRQN